MRKSFVASSLCAVLLLGAASLRASDAPARAAAAEAESPRETPPIEQLQGHLKKLYPDATVEAIPIADAVLLRGKVTKVEHAKQITEIAEQFYPKVLNQLEVAIPLEVPAGMNVQNAPGFQPFAAPLDAPFGQPTPTLRRLESTNDPFGQAEPKPLAPVSAKTLPNPGAERPMISENVLVPVKRVRTLPSTPAAPALNDSFVARPAESADKPASASNKSPGEWRVYDEASRQTYVLPSNLKAPTLLKPGQDPATAAPPPSEPDAQATVRELRAEVQDLRKDVQRMIRLLEKKQESSAVTPREKYRKEAHAEAEKAIRKALEKKISIKLEGTLEEFCQRISNDWDCNVVVHQLGLEEEGVTTETPVKIDFKDVKAGTALKLVLEPLHLTYTVEDGVIKITSRQRAKGKLVVCTYPVADLIVPVPNVIALASGLKPAEGEKKAAEQAATIDFDALTNLITSSVEPDSWDEVGGPASIRTFETTLSLVVRQTPGAHEQIADLLQQLRRLRDLQVTVSTIILSKASKDVLEKARIDSEKVGGLGLILDEPKAKALIESAQGNTKTNVFVAAKFTLFNGQAAEFAASAEPVKPGERRDQFLLQPTISADRRSVRMNVGLRRADAGGNIARPVLTPVPDGKSLLIDVTPSAGEAVQGVPVLQALPGTARLFRRVEPAPNGERTYLLLTPKIVVQEEEEELLGIPTK